MTKPAVSDLDARVAGLVAFLRRQYSVTIPASVVESVALLGFDVPKRDDTGADWRTCNVDDVLHVFVRAYHAGALAATPAPTPAQRACTRCSEIGNVDHDADVSICNLCVDAIQGGWPEDRYNPEERAAANVARDLTESERKRGGPAKLTIEQQFSHLAPSDNGFVDRVISDIARSNAAMAVDNATAKRSHRVEAPISGYLQNVFDTLAEFGLDSVHDAALARKLYRNEVKRLKAKKPQPAAAIKACPACRKANAIGWTCRACGARCCEHRCALKKNGGAATCWKCQAEIGTIR